MRIVMMGTGAFAIPSFESLVDSTHEVAALVTRPVPELRARSKAPANPMREIAEMRGIPVLTPDDVNAGPAQEQLLALRPHLLVVCDYGQILSRATLGLAPLGGINLHGSLLPKYRGAAPVAWAILQGDTETGVTVIHMTPRLDAGPILSTRKTVIGDGETAPELEARLSRLGVEAVHEAIRLLSEWDGQSLLGVAQDPAQATRAPRLQKSDGEVDWSRSARHICHQVRALKPWPGTFTYIVSDSGQPLRLILDEVTEVGGGEAGTATPGQVVASDGGRLLVATGSGMLEIRRIQPAGKRIMHASEFLRGHPIPPGTQLGPIRTNTVTP